MGEPIELRLVNLSEMKDWQFYEDCEHMNFWYEHSYHRPEEEDEAA
jgi:hypothetical protein